MLDADAVIERMADAIVDYEDMVGPEKAAMHMAVRALLYFHSIGSKSGEFRIPGYGTVSIRVDPDLARRLAAESN